MGILTELFLATAAEAQAYGAGSADRFGSVQLGGLTDLEFSTLWAILEGTVWSPEVHALHEVRTDEETWTFTFPAPFERLLRALDAAGIRTAAERWAATEELGCQGDDLEPVLTALVSLARSNTDPRRSIHLWGSL